MHMRLVGEKVRKVLGQQVLIKAKPGAATSAGAGDYDATSMQDDTSQAAPTVAGVVLLQEVPRSTSKWLVDGDDEDDNVAHTGKKFLRANTFESLVALDRAIKLGPPVA